MVGSMKTTNQDSKLNQKDSATEVDQKSKQAETVSAVPQEANVAVDLDNQYVGDQLDLPLVVTDTLAMASDSVDEVKKRKEKKDESEQNASQPEVDDEVVAESDESEVVAEGEVNAEETAGDSLVSEALEGESAASSDILGLSQTTFYLAALGLLSASAYYKNTNRDKAPTFASGTSAEDIAENSGSRLCRGWKSYLQPSLNE
jgi:hypothetical protein